MNIKTEPVNRDITAKNVRIAGESNIISLNDALRLAANQDLDLVQISMSDDIAICKILDYSNYQYQKKQKEKDTKKKQKVSKIKEYQLSPDIQLNDINTKAKNAKSALDAGNQVSITLRMMGRSSGIQSVVASAEEKINLFVSLLGDISVVKPLSRSGDTFLVQVRRS